jgi:hypothetical protein
LVRELESRRLFGRSSCRWEDIKLYLKEIIWEYAYLIISLRLGTGGRLFLDTVMTLRVPERLTASQEGLYSMELVTERQYYVRERCQHRR